MINTTTKTKIGDKMKGYKRLSPGMMFKNKKVQKFIIAILTFAVLFIICSMGVIPKKYNLKEGDVAPTNINSPRDFVDDIATQEKIDKAVSAITDKYSKNLNVRNDAIEKAKSFFEKAIEIKGMNLNDKEKIEKLKSSIQIELGDRDCEEALKLKEEELKNLSVFLENCLDKILSQDIMANNESDLKKAKDDLSFYIENSSISQSAKKLCYSIGIPLIMPNLYYDAAKTRELKEDAKRQIQPVIYKKNQNIVMKGEVVNSKHIYLMKKAGLLKDNRISDISLYIGVSLAIIIVETLIIWYIYRFRKNIYNDNSKLVILSIILCINSFFASGINIISGYLIPVSLIAMLASLIFDPLVAFSISIPSVLIVAFITNFNFEVVMIYLTGCISAILFISNAHERNNVVISGLSVGIINGIVTFSIGLINNYNIAQNILQSSMALGGGILSSIFAIGILPVFEQMFDIITPIKLLELSNPNHPLLKRLLFEAPGTYHHSILVGNLAEAAADEVNANSLLSRTGAYYHDIGKIKRPYFFKENQITNDNPHDKITPKLSTLIITSHVKDGIELSEKYRLPGAIKDIIEQHHGTTLVKYFYVLAANDGKDKVDESSFRYEGPKPQSREAAIVMLADSVEAAVHSLNNPAVQDIERMIDKVIEDKINDGQLDECDLTLKDIEKTKQSFIKVLTGMFHSRIEYPDINLKTEEGEDIVDRV